MTLLFPSASTRTLPIHLHGWKTARYESRRTMPTAGDLSAAYKKDEWVTIVYQRAPLREKIKSVYIQIYPHRIEYTFNFIFNRRPITMKVDHETLKKWNTPEPPPVPLVEKPRRKKKVHVDRFQCEWGVCRLDKHPDIPARWAAHISQNEGVIELEAVCESTRKEQARQKFEAFMARIEQEYPTSQLFVRSLDNPKPSQEYRQNAKKQGKVQRSAKIRTNPKGQPKTRKSPKIIEMPRLRIRSYGIA